LGALKNEPIVFRIDRLGRCHIFIFHLCVRDSCSQREPWKKLVTGPGPGRAGPWRRRALRRVPTTIWVFGHGTHYFATIIHNDPHPRLVPRRRGVLPYCNRGGGMSLSLCVQNSRCSHDCGVLERNVSVVYTMETLFQILCSGRECTFVLHLRQSSPDCVAMIPHPVLLNGFDKQLFNDVHLRCSPHVDGATQSAAHAFGLRHVHMSCFFDDWSPDLRHSIQG